MGDRFYGLNDGIPEDLSYMGSIPRHKRLCGSSCPLYSGRTETSGLCAEIGIVINGDQCRLEDIMFRGD